LFRSSLLWLPHARSLFSRYLGSRGLLVRSVDDQLGTPRGRCDEHNWCDDQLGKLTVVLILRENLLLCSSHLPLGVPNWPSTLRTNKLFLAPLPGRKRISARGVSHFQSFYFVIVLLSFFTLFLFASFYQKYKKN
jgi:hypothetical protein